MLKDMINAAPAAPNHTYADMHKVSLNVKKGINDQVRLIASPDGSTFNIVRGREGVKVGPNKARKFGPYSISDFDKEYDRLIKQGYRLTFDSAPAEIKVKTDGKYAAMPDISTDDLVKYLVEVSKQAFEDYYTASIQRIAQVPKASIDDARSIILQMEKEVSTLTVQEFNTALSVVYEILPRRIDNLWDLVAREPKDFPAIIARETNAIDVLEQKIMEALTGEKITDSQKQTICDAYGLTVEPVTEHSESYDEIMGRLSGKDSGDIYDNRGDYKCAWKITNKQTRNLFRKYADAHDIRSDDYSHGMSLLFHGSGTENIWSIIRFGLQTNPNAAICGKAYGHGIYSAVSSEKSLGYASWSDRWRSSDGTKRNFLMMFNVATGEIYDINGERKGVPDNYEELQEKHPGADCLWAYGAAGGFRHDEIVVYKNEQMDIKYLIETQRE